MENAMLEIVQMYNTKSYKGYECLTLVMSVPLSFHAIKSLSRNYSVFLDFC